MGRNTAGVVEINNGTSGQYRDLKFRNLLAVGATSGQTQLNAMAIAGAGALTLPFAGNLEASNGIVTTTVDQTATTETAHVVYTVQANTCTVGTTFRIFAWGNMDNGTTAVTFTPRLEWGGAGGVALISAPTVVSTTTALTNKTWKVTAYVTIRTIGATGTAFATLDLSNHTSNTAGTYTEDDSNTGVTGVTVDTTTNKDLDLTWALSTTTGTPHVRTLGGGVEIIKN
jgi:hypothetical protein